MSDIILRLKRPEGYDDVHPDIVVDDFLNSSNPSRWNIRVDDSLRTQLATAKECLEDLANHMPHCDCMDVKGIIKTLEELK